MAADDDEEDAMCVRPGVTVDDVEDIGGWVTTTLKEEMPRPGFVVP